ncbi:hypothetical protein G7085_01805 [Tessaracoccus sp. HDW20]|uniref:hypothetical protein n=1 Tax=Tessaracoccus coleopterorum TaxID=2714950 RepID=UPI0018D2E60C|nr:hypothetical protein [Tessaracoccus coleopterorum]NHB83847.1 hypothetical protein [Tessaracoccus coleopterorum]
MNYSYGFGSFLDDRRGGLTRGVVCGVAADAADLDAPTVTVPLPDAVVRDLATATLEPYTPDPLGEPSSLRPAYVVLVNGFGDPVTYVLGNDGEAFVNQPDGVQVWRAGDDVAAQWSGVLAQVRVTPFYQPPDVCGGYDPATMTGDPAKAVSGIVCAPPDALPAKGPELDPALAGEIGRLFAEGAGEEWDR